MGKKSTGKRRISLMALLCAAALILLGVLAFFTVFRVKRIDIEGNEHYSDTEIKKLAFTGSLSGNTLWMSKVKNHVDVSGRPFLDSVDIEYVDNHTLCVRVSEKYPIGVIVADNVYYYFDASGMVLATKTAEQAAADKAAADKAAADQAAQDQAAQDQAEASSDQTDAAGASSDQADAAGAPSDQTAASGDSSFGDPDAGKQQVKTYRQDITKVPQIGGLKPANLRAHKNLNLPDKQVPGTLAGIVRICDKFGIMPASIDVSDSSEFTLHYGNVRVLLGTDTLIEEKLTQLAGIYPNLGGLSGELDLANYQKDTQNIYFRKDQ